MDREIFREAYYMDRRGMVLRSLMARSS